MTPIIIAVEVDPNTNELPIRSPGLSFYARPESWENVPTSVERLTKEFEYGYPSWSGERKSYADQVRSRGNKLRFIPTIVP